MRYLSVPEFLDGMSCLCDCLVSARECIELFAGIATSIGVGVAAWQLWLSGAQERTSFEDSLAREYRELSHAIPVSAHLGKPLPDSEVNESLDEFFHYFTLSNDQVFLRVRGRIRKSTWFDWSSGIRSNMAKPAFANAWRQISEANPKSFVELRQFLEEDSLQDPKKW